LAKWPERSTRELADLLFNRAETWLNSRAGDLQKELSVQQQAGHSLQAAEALLKIALRKPDNQKYYYVPLLRVSSHESAA
jgi:hypothetical protein